MLIGKKKMNVLLPIFRKQMFGNASCSLLLVLMILRVFLMEILLSNS